MRRKQMFCK